MTSTIYPNAGVTSEHELEELPPTYETAVAAQPPVEPPPTYQSLFGDLQRARRESNGILDFLKSFGILLFSTIGCLVFLACFLAIPIASLVIGLEYRKQCTIQPNIPIYLIVFGAFGIFRNILCVIDKIKERLSNNEGSGEDGNSKEKACGSTMDIFLFVWFLCGNIWVYGISQPDFHNVYSSEHCNKTVYVFAFWLNTSIYIVFGGCCICCCLLGCCAAIFSDSDDETG